MQPPTPEQKAQMFADLAELVVDQVRKVEGDFIADQVQSGMAGPSGIPIMEQWFAKEGAGLVAWVQSVQAKS